MPIYTAISNDTSYLDIPFEELVEYLKRTSSAKQDGDADLIQTEPDAVTPKSNPNIRNFGGGLYAKRKRNSWCWFFKTTVERREKWIELGIYPQLSIMDARKNIQRLEKGITATKKTVKAKAIREDVIRACETKQPRRKTLKRLPTNSVLKNLLVVMDECATGNKSHEFSQAFSLLTLLPWITLDDIANITTGSLISQLSLTWASYIVITNQKMESSRPEIQDSFDPLDFSRISIPVVKTFPASNAIRNILKVRWEEYYVAKYRKHFGPILRATHKQPNQPNTAIERPDGWIPYYRNQKLVVLSGNEYLFPELRDTAKEERFSTVCRHMQNGWDFKDKLEEDSLLKLFKQFAEKYLPFNSRFVDDAANGCSFIKNFPNDTHPEELQLLGILASWWEKHLLSTVEKVDNATVTAIT
jgi:hypothetical protein